MKKTRAALLGMLLSTCIASMPLLAGPAQDTAEALKAVHSLSVSVDLKVYGDGNERGILLQNLTDKPIRIEDPTSFTALELAPGNSVGIACATSRMLAFTLEGGVSMDSFARGSVLRFENVKED